MLLAEEILLLLLDDQKGTMSGSASLTLDAVLGGALLCELTLAERIEAVPRKPGGKPDRLAVLSTAPTGDDLLDAVLARVAEREGKAMTDALSVAARKVKEPLIARLVERGALQEERTRLLGILPSRTLPAGDTRPEAEVRTRVGAVLAGHGTAEPRSAAVISLLLAGQVLDQAFPTADRQARKDQKGRAEEVAARSGAGEATRASVQITQAAILAAVVLPAFIATTTIT